MEIRLLQRLPHGEERGYAEPRARGRLSSNSGGRARKGVSSERATPSMWPSSISCRLRPVRMEGAQTSRLRLDAGRSRNLLPTDALAQTALRGSLGEEQRGHQAAHWLQLPWPMEVKGHAQRRPRRRLAQHFHLRDKGGMLRRTTKKSRVAPERVMAPGLRTTALWIRHARGRPSNASGSRLNRP